MRTRVALGVIAAGAACWALLAIDTNREGPPAASAGIAEPPPEPTELAAPAPVAPPVPEPPPRPAQPTPAAPEPTNHSELPRSPAAPAEPEPSAEEAEPQGDFSRDAPTILERKGELASSYARWKAAPEDPYATSMVTRHLEREINARYLKPTATYVDCRQEICRIKVTFERPEELARLRGIGRPDGLRFEFRGPEIHPGGATLVLYGLKEAVAE